MSKNKYKPGKNLIIKDGYFCVNYGLFVEYDGKEVFLVVRHDGKDYKQSYQEFINNCKNKS